MTDYVETCEWNPDENRPAMRGEHLSPARWSVGTGKNNFHLCDECNELPRFSKYRKRIPINRREWDDIGRV